MRHAVIYPGEDGWWVAEVPSLPGVVSQGRTREEAIANVQEAAELWIEETAAQGQSIPPEVSGPEVVTIFPRVA